MLRFAFSLTLIGLFLSSCSNVKKDTMADGSDAVSSMDVLTYLQDTYDNPEKDSPEMDESIISGYVDGVYSFDEMEEYLPYLCAKVEKNDSLMDKLMIAFLTNPESFNCDLDNLMDGCTTDISPDHRLRVISMDCVNDSMSISNNYVQFKKNSTEVYAKRLTPVNLKIPRGKVDFFGAYDKIVQKGKKYIVHGEYAPLDKGSMVQDTLVVDSNFFGDQRPKYWDYKLKEEDYAK